MRRPRRIFFPVLLVMGGTLLLLNNLGVLEVSVWALIWPLALILVGVSVLAGSLSRSSTAETRTLAIPLQGAEQARVHVEYGAGRLNIRSGEAGSDLLTGRFDGGVDHTSRRDGAVLDARLSVQSPFPWDWQERREWDFGLNRAIPLVLEVEMGAAEASLDLRDLRVTEFSLQTGASSTSVTLPEKAGHTRVKVEAGAASVAIRVPDGVAIRVSSESGLASVDVDTRRFPRTGKVWQSAEYDSAANRAEITLEVGAGSVDIR